MTARPVLLAFQARPAAVLVSRIPVGGRTATAIARTWDRGDEGRCRLCDECGVVDGRCLVLLDGFVGDEEATMFSTAGLARRREGLRVVGGEK